MGKERKVRITAEEGQILLRLSGNFALPDKLDEKTTFNVAERALAAKDAHLLYKELRSRSPLLVRDRRPCFGPADNWKSHESDGSEQWKLQDNSLEVEVSLSEDALSGVYWVLYLALNPASKAVMSTSVHTDIIWPVAEKLRLVRPLEKALGISGAEHKRLDLDPEPAAEAGTEETK